MPPTVASPKNRDWYESEINTAALVRAVLRDRPKRPLSAQDLWHLIVLTWITSHRGHKIEHWRTLKIPALEHLFDARIIRANDLQQSISVMGLPKTVATAALKRTGFVNAYRAYRISLKSWCTANAGKLRRIVLDTGKLKHNDQARFDLAARIAALPPVATPSGKRHMAAGNLVTPLVACIDPYTRFPIVNGKAGVQRRLKRLGLLGRDLDDQVRGLIGLIGQYGLVDAFAIDTMPDSLIEQITIRRKKREPMGTSDLMGTALPYLDDAERRSVQKSQTVTYRNLHKRMTSRLRVLLSELQLTQGKQLRCRYDVLAENYDAKGRDLLIEAKPDPDMGSIRIAIGQLLDYRRFLPRQAATDLALLTISQPSGSHLELLHDLQITALWFDDENCGALEGNGKAWKAVKSLLNRA